MADAKTTEAPKARRKPQGPRQERPTFLIVSYKDEQGNPIKLDPARLDIKASKDSAVLLKYFTGGAADSNSTVVELPVEKAAAKPAAPVARAAE